MGIVLGVLILGGFVLLIYGLTRFALRQQKPTSTPVQHATAPWKSGGISWESSEPAPRPTPAPTPARERVTAASQWQDSRKARAPWRAETLGELLDRKDVFVIDTETTGLGRRSEVLEVAVIDTMGRVLLNTVSLPQGPIPRDASDVHGLTRARLRTMGARPWPAVHAELALLLKDALSVIAWNAEFDRSMLEQTAERHGLILPAVLWRCAMQAEADTHGPDTAWSNLEDAAEYWGVPASDGHSAVGDARTTLAVVRRLAEPTGCQHPRREDQPATAEEALPALTAQELREVQRKIERFDVAARQARELFARLESGIAANDVPRAIRELDALKQECVTLAAYLAGSGIDVDASGVICELDALKLQFADREPGGEVVFSQGDLTQKGPPPYGERG